MTHEERMEITYRKFPHLRPEGWKPKEELKQSEDEIMPEPKIHGDICPHCGQHTLIHEEGCMRCISCLWSACG